MWPQVLPPYQSWVFPEAITGAGPSPVCLVTSQERLGQALEGV